MKCPHCKDEHASFTYERWELFIVDVETDHAEFLGKVKEGRLLKCGTCGKQVRRETLEKARPQ